MVKFIVLTIYLTTGLVTKIYEDDGVELFKWACRSLILGGFLYWFSL